MVTVKFNSLLRKAAGVPEYESQAASVKEVLKEIRSRYGKSMDRYMSRCVITVNGRNINELKGNRTKLSDGDEVSLFPLVAGG
jgi:MoaD family protein